jgi:hypothetical protein
VFWGLLLGRGRGRMMSNDFATFTTHNAEEVMERGAR